MTATAEFEQAIAELVAAGQATLDAVQAIQDPDAGYAAATRLDPVVANLIHRAALLRAEIVWKMHERQGQTFAQISQRLNITRTRAHQLVGKYRAELERQAVPAHPVRISVVVEYSDGAREETQLYQADPPERHLGNMPRTVTSGA